MEHLIFLHGAIGAKDQLQPTADLFKDSYNVHLVNFAGHGGDEIPEVDFSMQMFCDQVLQFMNEQQIDKANLFGYSMGGYVAMTIAKQYPDRVNKIITLATKYYWDEAVAAAEAKKLNPELIKQKVPAFAEQLKRRHSDWELVLSKTAALLTAIGKNNELKQEDYALIKIPVLLLLGDRDKMITLEETLNAYKSLPNAQFGILPGTPHPVEQINLATLSIMINQFLSAL